VGKYISYRLLLLLPTLFGVSVAVFLLIHLIPGDLVAVLLGMHTSPEAAAALHRMFGLDQPLIVQYGKWLGGLCRGDLGYSLRTGQAVSYLLVSRLVVSAELACLGLAVAVLVGVPLGVGAALKRNTLADFGATSIALIGLSVPDFWLATLLVLLLSVKAGWLPPSGYVPLLDAPLENLKLMIMPAIAVAAGSASYIMRMTRSLTIDVMSEDYVRTASAKGLAWPRVVSWHIFPNVLVSLLTVIGQQMGYLIGGVVVVEAIFALPGVGRTALESIYNRDYPVVMGAVLMIAVLYVLINLLVDVLGAFVDPRIRDRLVEVRR
jgi:peptide/nickel transport system permease protein